MTYVKFTAISESRQNLKVVYLLGTLSGKKEILLTMYEYVFIQ